MTIEFSLRQRAKRSRFFACAYLCLAVVILIGGFLSLPFIAEKTLRSITQMESVASNASGDGNTLHIFALIILIVCLLVISFAGFLLARGAMIEMESSVRFNGIADALCLAGDDLQQFEVATAVLVPKTKYFPEFSEKNLKVLLELLKTARG